jgi:hypothetical protein
MAGALQRRLFLLTVAWGTALIWLCPELPLVDMPQHAAQVSLFRELLAGQSAWKGLVSLNFFTPYALEYGLGLLFATFLPVNVALQVLLTLGYLGFVATCVRFRRELGGDERLDWFFVPTYFGYAWVWGFIPFLIAWPLAVLFVAAARRHAERPDLRAGVRLLVLGALLFFTHGLAFLFALLAAALYLAALLRAGGRLALAHVWPYLELAALPVLYQLTRHVNAQLAEVPDPLSWTDGILGTYGRAKMFVVYPFGLMKELGQLAPLGLALLAAPAILGVRLNRAAFGWWVPFAAICLIYFGAPSTGMHFAHLQQRFALFTLPAYALLFARREPGPARARLREAAGIAAMALVCWSYFGVQTARFLRFRRESAAAVAWLEGLPEGKRVLQLPFAPASAATGQDLVYLHFFLWYQASRRGLVDVSFASATVQVVRYEPGSLPKLPRSTEMRPWQFSYEKNEGWIYDYIVVKGRDARALASIDAILHNPICPMRRTDGPDDWTLLERGDCKAPL